MIAFAPLLKFSSQVVVRLTSQARQRASALAIRTVTSDTGRNIGGGNSIPIYGLPFCDERLVSVICRFGFQRRKICRQGVYRFGANLSRSTPHILFRKWIVSRVGFETQKLIFEVLRSLSR